MVSLPNGYTNTYNHQSMNIKTVLVALAIAWIVCPLASAQEVQLNRAMVADTNNTDLGVIGGRPQRSKHSSRKANVLGTPVYYDTNGNVIGGKRHSEVYQRPRHHYLNNLDDRYSTFFFEGEALVGAKNIAGGINFTVLPNRWGGYGSLMAGIREHYFTLGPVVRLSDASRGLDWHLYGGMVIGWNKHIGVEGGVRVAAPKRRGEFCWMSGSAGMAVINGDAYATLGVSIDIMACIWLCTLIL